MIRVRLVFFIILSPIQLVGVASAADDVVYRCGGDRQKTEGISDCGFGDVIELPGVDFVTGSAQLTTKAASILDRLAKQFEKHDDIRLEVAGHTDDLGSSKNNRGLSRRRAATVRTYLILKGVDEARLTAQGYGESSPIADNTSEDGRKKNRRVELRVVDIR